MKYPAYIPVSVRADKIKFLCKTDMKYADEFDYYSMKFTHERARYYSGIKPYNSKIYKSVFDMLKNFGEDASLIISIATDIDEDYLLELYKRA